MKISPSSDVVSNQYEQWIYPEPILDLPAWLSGHWEWFDPIHSHRLFWPDRTYWKGIDILVAGCGSNQAAVIAYTNPDARVVAIDVSQNSLDHQQLLKERYDINNLELHLLPIEQAKSLNLEFDLIISTGVLHHLLEPKQGMKALAECLRKEGVIALMLYAKYGRIGVEMLQGVFRELGLGQNEDSILMVKEVLAGLGQDHPIWPYFLIAEDLKFDTGLVDTFLHQRDRSYSINDCFELVNSAGLVVQDFFLKAPYHLPTTASSAFHSALAGMPEQQKWSIMERINVHNGCHYFTACRADRARKSYKIDFDSPDAIKYVPSFRYRCNLESNQLTRSNWSINLDPIRLSLVKQIDGHRTIQEIVYEASHSGALPALSQTEMEEFGVSLIQELWQLDFLAIGLESNKGLDVCS
ncbi:class I SAM-dependent methyltransferase [Cyanobium sp. Maggiore-St4-Cus]|uniref:class I SAM-dependent methyltransferase n=1 Tax=Cyanobium sp. Maggiore-St4-Cus TaxID=2823717 RepID=UPI0020CC191E|nr:class I SAM-dependent methyltransferase [Cyanobium sp. Maggiore-St4-Cus]MCP9790013.1 class I SAM-dependent methyltransferase [Cyanobium sp. Maggiore-St4-Cus]